MNIQRCLLAACLWLSLSGAADPAGTPTPSTDAGFVQPAYSTPWLLVNTEPVLWDEYYFWLRYANRVNRTNLPSIDARQDAQPGSVNTIATQQACQRQVIMQQARNNGILWGDQDEQRYQSNRLQQIRTYGGEREYLLLLSRMYISEAVFHRLRQVDVLGHRLFERLYGYLGEQATEEEVRHYVESRKLVHVAWWHLTGDHAESRLARARDEVLASSNPAGEFLQRMPVLNHHDSMQSYPTGRLMRTSALPDAIVASVTELTSGEISDVLATAKGAYVVQRLPLDADTRVNNTDKPLRHWAAYDGLFKDQVRRWCEQAKIQPAQRLTELTDDLARRLPGMAAPD